MAKKPINEVEAKRFKGKFDKNKKVPFLTKQEEEKWLKLTNKNK